MVKYCKYFVIIAVECIWDDVECGTGRLESATKSMRMLARTDNGGEGAESTSDARDGNCCERGLHEALIDRLIVSKQLLGICQ